MDLGRQELEREQPGAMGQLAVSLGPLAGLGEGVHDAPASSVPRGLPQPCGVGHALHPAPSPRE